MSTHRLVVPGTLLGLVLAGASALAGQEPQTADSKAVHDCCAPKAGQQADDPCASTPLLAQPSGPLAAGRVVFVGPRPPADAGGKASFEGDRPEVKPLVIDPSKSEGCVPGGGAMDTTDRSLLISEGGGVANVVITVEVEGAELKVPEKAVHMDQTKCRFEPHVVVIPAGATVEFMNSDEVSHNVHTYPKKNDAMNKTIGVGSKETQVFGKADQVEIKCDLHPWMNSWLIVTDAPYYAVTKADGSFAIAGLPAGTHKVEYWHEKLGKGKAEMTVNADGTAQPLEITLSAESKGGGRRRR